MTNGLSLLSGHITRLDRKKCRGAWGIAELTHFVAVGKDAKSRRTTSTVVGNGVALFSQGDVVDVVGSFEKSDYGLQFKAIRITLAPPDTDAEMDKWFTSVLPHVDKIRLAEIKALAQGTTLREFLSKPDVELRLVSIPGITEERATLIASAWRQARSLHDDFHRLAALGLTSEEVRDLLKRSVDIGAVATNPFILFEERVVSMARLEAMLKAHFPESYGTTRHRTYLVLNSIRELTDDTGSTAARLEDVLEHVRLRSRNVTVDRLRAIAESHPGVFSIIGDKIQSERLASAEALIAEYVSKRAS